MKTREIIGIAILGLSCCASAWAGNGNAPAIGGIYAGNLGAAGDQAVPGRLLVRFADDVNDATADVIARGAGAKLERAAYRRAFHILTLARGTDPERALATLSRHARVRYAHLDCLASASLVPNDPYFSPYQWNLDNPAYGGIRMQAAWDLSGGGSPNVVVAVLDTGVAYETYGVYVRASDLTGTTFVPGYDFINSDAHPNDDNGHGTHVTGTIAQTTNNGLGVAGIAYKTAIMPVKVLAADGTGAISAIAQGIRWAADNGAKVISMSLGATASPKNLTVLSDAVTYAAGKGVVLVAASGNGGTTTVEYPAAYPSVIAVGATTYDNTRAYYSNTGTALDLVAPGGTDQADLNGDGQPDMILQQTLNPTTKDPADINYWFMCGTSMATPHVSAVAALLFAAGATSGDQVRQILQSTATDLGTAGFDTTFGYGLVNATAALEALLSADAPPTVAITSPTAGATVAGTVTIAATATDDEGVAKVDFLVYNVLAGTDADGADGWSCLWATTAIADGTHTLTAVATDSAGQTARASVTVTVANAPVATSLHVGDLDGVGISVNAKSWKSQVTVLVHDSSHKPVAGVTVYGTWSGGYNGTVTGITGTTGLVTVSSGSISKTVATETFTVTSLKGALPYNSTLNHDPDGDSNGTVIIVKKP